MSSVLWSFMNCLAVVFVKEDFLSTFLKRKKNRWIFICVWMFYFLFHLYSKKRNVRKFIRLETVKCLSAR